MSCTTVHEKRETAFRPLRMNWVVVPPQTEIVGLKCAGGRIGPTKEEPFTARMQK
jgi:hypothetical protein